jgi:hypothetical protein
MRYVIRLVGLTSGEPSEDEARYLCRLRERAGGGREFLASTPDAGRALDFETAEAAFEFWHSGPASSFHAVIEACESLAR